MEIKNEIITTTMNAPEGYEIDWENSVIEKGKEVKIIWKPIEKKDVTYDDVCRKLFYRKTLWFTNGTGKLEKFFFSEDFIDRAKDLNNATSEQQLYKMLAFNKLMNIAEYLNDGWKPDWNNYTEFKHFIKYRIVQKEFDICSTLNTNNGVIYFKTRELALQAIEIMGEKSLKDLFQS